MSEQRNSTSTATPSPLPNGQVVSIMVANDHPLLQLKRALNWEAKGGDGQALAQGGQKHRW